MNTVNLKPFIRDNMDVLFVGLNLSDISNNNKHYFSVYDSFWNQLYRSGLINSEVDKMDADIKVFGSNKINKHSWNYGIMDLKPNIADRHSNNIKLFKEDYDYLTDILLKYKPKVACIIHNKVIKSIKKYNEEFKITCKRLGKFHMGD